MNLISFIDDEQKLISLSDKINSGLLPVPDLIRNGFTSEEVAFIRSVVQLSIITHLGWIRKNKEQK